jgi:acetyl esterase/lipase
MKAKSPDRMLPWTMRLSRILFETKHRATFLALLTFLLFAPNARAQDQAPPLDPALGISTIPLYSAAVPGAKGAAAVDTPTLTVFRPIRPNGTAVIVDPGGAYIHLASNHEGRQEADRLAELGVTTFVLRYRLNPTYPYPIPLEDARRAVRLVRSLAATYGYAPDRIGMMGFSAGGHLAAITGTLPDPGRPNDPDPVERQSSAVNFMILIYPWLNAMQPQVPNPKDPNKPLINYCSVTPALTQADCARLRDQYTPVNHVTAQTPPTFIVHTADDNTVPVATSVEFFTAMHKAGADCELHIFAHGPHGFGTGGNMPELYAWQDLLASWLRSHNLLTPSS